MLRHVIGVPLLPWGAVMLHAVFSSIIKLKLDVADADKILDSREREADDAETLAESEDRTHAIAPSP